MTTQITAAEETSKIPAANDPRTGNDPRPEMTPDGIYHCVFEMTNDFNTTASQMYSMND